MESDIFLAKVKCDEGGMGMYITGKDDLSRKLAKAFWKSGIWAETCKRNGWEIERKKNSRRREQHVENNKVK